LPDRHEVDFSFNQSQGEFIAMDVLGHKPHKRAKKPRPAEHLA